MTIISIREATKIKLHFFWRKQTFPRLIVNYYRAIWPIWILIRMRFFSI